MATNRSEIIATLARYKKLARSKDDRAAFDYAILKIQNEMNQTAGMKFVRLGDGTRKLIPEKKAMTLLKKPVSERVYVAK